ncbi:MAG: branched-chain amino acid ABC transporter permease [Gammaproteobacteria bacterium]|nr:branched-chain amino acid ABC transporter permease [Rhodocyclaceae bacterium]MBU3907976.1 branched-chain amino acid ABC transporter permease [Gammaproteobacteria bacterium]MBU3990642.1 branched-chain amino acid ABC transporter permease [Gammaproteobacteria bacterium]MBU4006093.1 branched-chain amino acid ABC transporter permease [Gammaproteobacteria bacterium]MBU4022094.1 branched-chain amino acid ABC transporter permease [Gammaproteobacteria bacterium]
MFFLGAVLRKNLFAVAALVLLVLLLAVPWVPQVVYPVFVMKLLCMALFACAYSLLLGFGGMMSFGHAAFFGSAAYITGLVTKYWGFPPEVGLLAGTLFAAGLGAVFGALAIHRQGIYLAMITLALAQMVYFIFLQLPFTGAEDGLQQIPRGTLFGFIDLRNDVAMYHLVLLLTLGGLWLIYRVVHSPFGHVVVAIREHEPRARSLGYPVERYKLMLFVISAALSGLAGSMKALVFQLAALSDVHWHLSGDVVLMALLGGMHTVFGPAVGAAVVVGLQYYLDAFGGWVTLITGLIFMVCVLSFRSGIAGAVLALRTRPGLTP